MATWTSASCPPISTNSVRFVYVAPWRWTTKKGIAGNIASGLNVQWFYNWNIDQNSSRDLGIRADPPDALVARPWPELAGARRQPVAGLQRARQRIAGRLLTVGDAIWSWPDLLGTGLRVGSPAPTDGGRSGWLYPFMQQADAAGLRVDFVAVHYYQCVDPGRSRSGAANQMYNFLKATYDQVKRPIWITEWNNGANWTGCGDPTFAQQRAAIDAMIRHARRARRSWNAIALQLGRRRAAA